MYRILLIVVVLIVYGSLYPWDLHSSQLAARAQKELIVGSDRAIMLNPVGRVPADDKEIMLRVRTGPQGP